MHNGRPEQRSGYCTDVFFNAAMDFMAASKGRPFFTYLATNAPHVPLQVDDSYVAPFRQKGLDETTARTYGMLANLDENTGRLLTFLQKEGLENDTILIFMSDNGPTPARFNSGMRGLKGTVYEGGIRVPFFVRWPGAVRPGVKIDRLAAHIDVFPTLLDACGITRTPGSTLSSKIDGVSLYSLLRHPDAASEWPDRTVYFQWHRGDRGELYNNCAARTQRYKMIDGKELYDLDHDPAESRNLAASQPERLAQLRSGYEAWFHDVAATRNFEPPRIYLGTPFENPVLLTRQDWRGPQASWAPGGLGYWEVDVRQPGDYECSLLFPAATAAGLASATLGGAKGTVSIAEGSKSAVIYLASVAEGPSRVEAALTLGSSSPVGPYYVNVRRQLR